MREFPKTRAFVTGWGRRNVRGGPSMTEIIVLDDEGIQRTQYGQGGWFGVYYWNGKEWELDAVYSSREDARKAAARIRRSLLHSK
jgi:hypothetical protein